MFDKRLRSTVEKRLRPVAANLRRTGLTADHFTVLGVSMSLLAAVAIANGWLEGGLVLLILTAVPDVLDGAVAKASGTASPRGAFFDSVCDRVADALLLGGIAWYLSNTEGGHVVLLPMAVLAASLIISYERAKADSLGYDARGGLMERAERLIFLGFGLLFESLLVAVLWVMLALTLFTAVQRFVNVWRQASVEVPIAVPVSQRQAARLARTSERRRVRRERREMRMRAREARRRIH
jgi:CDP-diacylglycerol--glycerol-3-phosphate 3-phosphatidyltransferase